MTGAASPRTAAADALVPAHHPFAGHLALAAAAESAAPQALWTPEDGPLPSLYISHGAPPLFEAHMHSVGPQRIRAADAVLQWRISKLKPKRYHW